MAQINEQELQKALERAREISEEYFKRRNDRYLDNMKLIDEVNNRMVEETGFKMLFPTMAGVLGFKVGTLFHHQEHVAVLGFAIPGYSTVVQFDPEVDDAVPLLKDESISRTLPNLSEISKLMVLLESMTDVIKNDLKEEGLSMILKGDDILSMLGRIIGGK